MDCNVVKVQEMNGQDSETAESDFIPSKSTSKLIRNCMQCIGALIQHVENVVSHSNGLIVVNNSSKVKSDDGNDIDVVEHSVKHDPDGASRYLRSIKKCVLQLCLLCVEQNIYVTCDLSSKKIDFYDCLDDSTRSLVINYLTENIGYLIEHIGFIISMFKQEKNREEAKDITKSLQKIYKQILMVPLNPNLDETPDVFKDLNSSQWYSESMQYLEEKLSVLRTSLIKFKKTLNKVILDSNYTDSLFENIEMHGTKRINNDITDQPSPKRMKRNDSSSPDHLFRVPDIPSIHKPDVITVENGTERKKKKKHRTESETNLTTATDVVTVESDTESVKKKKKLKNKSENDSIIINTDTESLKKKQKTESEINVTIDSSTESGTNVIVESDSDSVKKIKKHKSKSINDSIIVESDTESLKKKRKHKLDINKIDIKRKKKHKTKSDINLTIENDTESGTNIIVESDTESFKKIEKDKSKSINDSIIVESDTESLKKKKKQEHKLENNEIVIKRKKKQKSKSDINLTIESDIESGTNIIIESDTESFKKIEKDKTKSKNESIIVECDTESLKKKRKHKLDINEFVIKRKNKQKSKSEINLTIESETESGTNVIVEIDTESVKKIKKHKSKSKNDSILIESDTESSNKIKKRKHKLQIQEIDISSDISEVVILENAELKRKDKKHKRKKDKNMNISESIDITNTNSDLFLSQEISDETQSISSCSSPDKSHKNSIGNKESEETCEFAKTTKDLEEFFNNSDLEKSKMQTSKDVDEDLSQDWKKSKMRTSSQDLKKLNNIKQKKMQTSKDVGEDLFQDLNKSNIQTSKHADQDLSQDLEKPNTINQKKKQTSTEPDKDSEKPNNIKQKKKQTSTEPDKDLEKPNNIKQKKKQTSTDSDLDLSQDLDKSKNIKPRKIQTSKDDQDLEKSKNIKQRKLQTSTDSNQDLSQDLEKSKNIKQRKMQTSKDGDQELKKSKNIKQRKLQTSTDSDQDLSQDLKKSKNIKQTKRRTSKHNDENLCEDIFSALSNGDLVAEYYDEVEDEYQKILTEGQLNENERFLYLQDLVHEGKKSKELSKETINKLQNLFIIIDWKLPPLHKVECYFTQSPKPEQQAELEKLGVCTMRFNLDEDDLIRRNFNEFCRLYDFDTDPKPFISLGRTRKVFLYKQRKRFVQFLGKDLPNRSLNSIYRRFKVLYCGVKTGRYQPQEDELILTYCKKIYTKDRFSALANILKRDRNSIEIRYRILTRESNERIRWTLEKESDLVKNLLKTIDSESVEDLKHFKFTCEQYHKVADEMKIPREKIRIRWLGFIYPKLFAKETIQTNSLKLKLIQMLIDSGLTDWNKIDWNEIVSHFEGLSKEFLWSQLMQAEVLCVPKKDYKNLGKVLNYFKNFIGARRKEKAVFTNRIIPRYRMTENGLEQYE